MNNSDIGSPTTRARMATIILASLLGLLGVVCIGAPLALIGLGGAGSSLTIPNLLFTGASLGASAGGVFALLLGLTLGRNFAYVFGLALGGFAYLIAFLLLGDGTNRTKWIQLDLLGLGLILLGVFIGASVRRSVSGFGTGSRRLALIGAALTMPVGGILMYRFLNGRSFGEVFLIGVAIVATIGGMLGAICGAFRTRPRKG
jgi:hypothetical protein